MYQQKIDLAGEVCFRPNFWQTKGRINYLINEYLNLDELRDLMEELPDQFRDPQPRQWSKITWQDINPDDVIGIELNIFLSIIKGALDTEAPIRGYTQASRQARAFPCAFRRRGVARQYLEPIHPSMAKFVGGSVSADGKMTALGLWEKEERQHTPALIKIYQQLSHDKIIPQPKTAKVYQARENPYQDLYKHGLHRVATEYSAVCLYIWLMSHTTGTTQQVLGELLQDEVNHLTKFLGMGMWLYPDGTEQLIKYLLNQIHTILPVSSESDAKSKSTLKSTFQRMMSVLNWQSWSILSQGELIYTFIWTLKQMYHWSSQLTPEYLQSCCASPEFFGNNNLECDRSEIIIF
ncbi:ferritin-like domain-containing protein [Waterburya agarophytonicola K14]|uniref:Ferritin-like domain-containing protein n=1 Tax=Waterburya agarophytonicola KI4 TaxID=2874699 RepID=A0A964BPV6_9CYAN|nr:ferritin-like domain-containing protein [Waterburya agarophytonicola]MCC0176303.1 ferritin-like domain-containing protein [Waterburya agarophytonicola KI4]